MCHLCEKLQLLNNTKALPAPLTKPLASLLQKLHSNINPHLGDFWLWRLNRALEVRRLIKETEEKLPGGRMVLRELLGDVEEQIIHIKMNMVEHPPRKSTGRLHELKGEIWPRESASGGEAAGRVRWEEDEELRLGEGGLSMESRVGARNDDRPREGSTNSREMENTHKVRFVLPERQGTPIHPSLAVQVASIKRVFAWLIDCNEATAGEAEQDNERESVVSLDGVDVERPKLDVKLWTRVKTALSSRFSQLGRSTPWSERRDTSQSHQSTNGDCESGQRLENANSKNNNAQNDVNRSQKDEDHKTLDDQTSEEVQTMGPRLSKRAMEALRTMAGGSRRSTTSAHLQTYSDDDSFESESTGSFLSSRASELNLGSIIEKSRPAKSESQRRGLREVRTTSTARKQTARAFEHLEKQELREHGRHRSGDSFFPVAPARMPRERAHKHRVRYQYSDDSFVPTAPEPLPPKEDIQNHGSRSANHHHEKPLPPLRDSNQNQTQQSAPSGGIQHRRKGENIMDEGEEITATRIAIIAAGKSLNVNQEALVENWMQRTEAKGFGGDDMTARRNSGSRRRAERISPDKSADVLTTSKQNGGAKEAWMAKSREFAGGRPQEQERSDGGNRGASENVLRRRAERAREKQLDYNVTERSKYWGQ